MPAPMRTINMALLTEVNNQWPNSSAPLRRAGDDVTQGYKTLHPLACLPKQPAVGATSARFAARVAGIAPTTVTMRCVAGVPYMRSLDLQEERDQIKQRSSHCVCPVVCLPFQ